jgi:hypothetical protein
MVDGGYLGRIPRVLVCTGPSYGADIATIANDKYYGVCNGRLLRLPKAFRSKMLGIRYEATKLL